MGSHIHTYLGPYVRVPKKHIEVEEKVFGCLNVDCRQGVLKRSRDVLGSFCSACGSQHGTTTRMRKCQVDRYEVIQDELHEVGDKGGFIYLVPNTCKPNDPRPKQRHNMGYEESVHVDLHTHEDASEGPPPDMNDEIEWFVQAFAPELEKLRAAYGAILVSWGYHQYVM
jgi:transcription elongation factor Elf1